jgi:hypothetical protein
MQAADRWHRARVLRAELEAAMAAGLMYGISVC